MASHFRAGAARAIPFSPEDGYLALRHLKSRVHLSLNDCLTTISCPGLVAFPVPSKVL